MTRLGLSGWEAEKAYAVKYAPPKEKEPALEPDEKKPAKKTAKKGA